MVKSLGTAGSDPLISSKRKILKTLITQLLLAVKKKKKKCNNEKGRRN